jgi:hypothetical protein
MVRKLTLNQLIEVRILEPEPNKEMILKSCPNDQTHEKDAQTLIYERYGVLGQYPNDTLFLAIEVVGGFERYNTRPYHNYETWSIGYAVSTPRVEVDNECLLCALEAVFDKEDKLFGWGNYAKGE